MIRIEKLSVSYGESVVVDDLSVEVNAGVLFGLLGPNGAGKTTTLGCLCGLHEHFLGTAELNGIDVREDPRRAKSMVGYVPQELALYPELTVLKNLEVFGGLAGLNGRSLSSRIDWALEVAQLSSRRRDLVDTLSGGMKRRLNMVASLLHRPKVIVCDEPTTGVDPQSRNHLFETIKRFHQDGCTVIYTTHYMEEVEALCEDVAIMDHGHLIAHDKLDILLQDKANLEELFLELTGRGLRDAP